MSYAIKLNGRYYNGTNCQGMATYGSAAESAKHFYDRDEASRINDEIVGGEVVLVLSWGWRPCSFNHF